MAAGGEQEYGSGTLSASARRASLGYHHLGGRGGGGGSGVGGRGGGGGGGGGGGVGGDGGGRGSDWLDKGPNSGVSSMGGGGGGHKRPRSPEVVEMELDDGSPSPPPPRTREQDVQKQMQAKLQKQQQMQLQMHKQDSRGLGERRACGSFIFVFALWQEVLDAEARLSARNFQWTMRVRCFFPFFFSVFVRFFSGAFEEVVVFVRNATGTTIQAAY